jgi:hypothetical protein
MALKLIRTPALSMATFGKYKGQNIGQVSISRQAARLAKVSERVLQTLITLESKRRGTGFPLRVHAQVDV